MTESQSENNSAAGRATQGQESGRSLWLTSAAIVFGLLVGVGFFTFVYARGGSYLTDDPNACANCHVMQEQHASWMKGSHRAVAVCNDCHTPQGIVPKYLTKAQNGFLHSLAFTTGYFPDHIQIHSWNYRVTQESCSKCHEEVVTGIQATREHNEKVDCIQCHMQVGHQ